MSEPPRNGFDLGYLEKIQKLRKKKRRKHSKYKEEKIYMPLSQAISKVLAAINKYK